MKFFSSVGLVAGLVSLAAAQLGPQPPSKDPWYAAPANISAYKNGEIVRTRTIIPAFIGLIPALDQTWQLLYRTTDLNGNAIAAATTVFKPGFAATDKFVTFLTAEDSSYVDSAPSYNYQLLSATTDAIVSAEFLILQIYLAQGWIVSSPDYEGPEAAWTAGRLEAQITLDSMRAVNNFYAPLGLKANSANAIAGVGYSGGAIASGWSAQIQASYAPELQLKGWYVGGTPANLTALVPFISYTSWSGFLPISVAGLSKPTAYGAQIAPLFQSVATDYGRAAIAYANSHGPVEVLVNYANQSILDYKFQTLGPALLQNPIVADVLAKTLMGQSADETPKVPVLLLHAAQDEIVPYGPAATLYSEWCAYGASVHFTTLAAGGHLVGEIYGVGPAVDFVKGVFNGTIVAGSGCSTSTALAGSGLPDLGVKAAPAVAQLNVAAIPLALADAGNVKAIKTTVST